MNKKRKKFLLTAGLLLLTGLIVLYTLKARSSFDIHQLVTTDLQGNPIEMRQLTKKPIVINYWATWCKPCLEEFPHFEKVRKAFDDEVAFIMISDEPIEKIQAFINTRPYGFIFLRSTKRIANYGVSALPTSHFYYPGGEFSAQRTGSVTTETLKNLIKTISY